MGLWAAQKGTLPTEPQPQDLNIFPCNQLLPLYLVLHQLSYEVVKGHQAVRGRPKPSVVTWGRTTLSDRGQNSEVPEQGMFSDCPGHDKPSLHFLSLVLSNVDMELAVESLLSLAMLS